MKIKYTSIIAIIFVFLIFYKCFHCIDLFFEKDETYWIDPYEKGDVLVFNANDKKSNDTIFIMDKTSYKPKGDCNPIEVSNYDYESCIVDYRFKHDKKMSDSDYLIQHVKEKEGSSIPILRVVDLEYSRHELRDTTVILNKLNIKLNDCYSFHKNECHVGWSVFKIKTFVWSKKLGLVIFVGENGDKFELVKHIRR